MAEVGIFITAKDLASRKLKQFGERGKKNVDIVKKIADKAKASFSLLGGAITTVNQALEIGRKAWEVTKRAMELTVGEALRFRKAGDSVSKWFEAMKRDTELLQARIGDALIPVIQGLAEGFGLVGRGMSDWVKENRKLIASKVLEYIINLGEALINSVGKGVLLVTKAWTGWQQAVALAEAGINDFFFGLLEGITAALKGMGELAAMVGADGLAKSLNEVADSASLLGDEFGRSGGEAMEQFEKLTREGDKLERKINEGINVALTKLGDAGALAQQKIAESTAGTTKTIEEQTEAINANAEAQRAAAELAAKLEAEAAERRAKLAEEEAERIKAAQQSIADAAASANEFMGGLIDSIATETAAAQALMAEAQQAAAEGSADAVEKLNAAQEAQGKVAGNVAKQAASAIIDSVTAQLSAMAIQAAAGAFASQASIPFVGPALGAAAAVAASAAVMALGAGLKGLLGGMAAGGVVTGGMPGRDSVGALLMPGEQVMSIGERQAMQKFMSRLLGTQAGQAAGGLVGQTAAPSGQPIVVHNQTVLRTWTPHIQEETQMARRLEEESRKRLARQGMLMGGFQAPAGVTA